MRIAARTRSVLTVLTTVLALAAGAMLWHKLPASTDVFAPFDVHGSIGQRTAGRGVAATVDAVTITPTLTVAPSGQNLGATGIWVVIEGGFEAGADYALMHAELRVGPNRYLPTERVIAMPAVLQPGIVDRRGWAFDVAPARLDTVGTVVFGAWVGDGRLDSRLGIDIPLDDRRVQHLTRVDLPSPTQETR